MKMRGKQKAGLGRLGTDTAQYERSAFGNSGDSERELANRVEDRV